MVTLERVGMPMDEFIREHDKQTFDLINGERKYRMPGVSGHSYTIRTLFRLLDGICLASGEFEVLQESTFILPERYDRNWVTGSRTPDLMLLRADQLITFHQENPDWRDRPYQIIPELVIEVISPTDLHTEVDEKVQAYLSDGVRLVILVDPQLKSAMTYTPDGFGRRLEGDMTLDGGNVLPEFRVTLSEIFE
jgi:Uma2 family endonuclease